MDEINRPSPNRKPRPDGEQITAIVVHTTGGSIDGAVSWMCNPESKVSAHVAISKEGDVIRIVADHDIAFHAGMSVLHGKAFVNVFSLGMELERTATDVGPYPYMQLNAAAQWCAEKCNQYHIPLNRIVGHADVAPGRKVDPEGFPWQSFLLEVAERMS